MPVRKRILPSGEIAWSYTFDAPGSTKANRKQIYKSGFATKKDATDAEAARRIAVHKESELVQLDELPTPEGQEEGAARNTLAALFEQFFREHGAKSLSPKTLSRYRDMVQYLDPELRAMPVTAIRPLRLAREWNRLLTSGGRGRKQGKPLSRKTVRNIAGLVSSAFMRAFRWGIVESNPVPASEPPAPLKKEAVALTPAQQDQLIDGADTPWGLDVFLALDAATGLRRGELLALRWQDIDQHENRDRISVTRSLAQVKGEVFFKETKSKKNRTVSLPKTMMIRMALHRAAWLQRKQKAGQGWQGDLIFCADDGAPLRPDSVSAAVSLLCKKLGLPKGASLHTLRHTHGSHLLAAGVPLPDVSKRLGHADPHVTATIYAHALDGGDNDAAQKWEEYEKKNNANKAMPKSIKFLKPTAGKIPRLPRPRKSG